jgi:hypothetical protein
MRRPLSQRDNPEAAAPTLVEGIPDWLQPSLAKWIGSAVVESLTAYTIIAPDLLGQIERHLHLTLNWRSGPESAAKSLLEEVFADPEIGLDIVDTLLEIRSGALRTAPSWDVRERLQAWIVALKSMLDEAGSAWTVSYNSADELFELRKRVDPTLVAAAADAMGRKTRAAEHLQLAWADAYGRKPDPSSTYLHAVKAVEAAGRGIIIPKDPKATLGLMINAVAGKPQKWKMRFTDAKVEPMSVVLEMMKLLWTAQIDRHGTDESQPVSVSPEEARDALHLAVTLVQWFESGAISVV